MNITTKEYNRLYKEHSTILNNRTYFIKCPKDREDFKHQILNDAITTFNPNKNCTLKTYIYNVSKYSTLKRINDIKRKSKGHKIVNISNTFMSSIGKDQADLFWIKIKEYLDLYDEKLYDIISLRFIYRYKWEEIEEKTGNTISTLRRKFNKAIKILKNFDIKG